MVTATRGTVGSSGKPAASGRLTNPVLAGAIGGLAWAASLRAFMVELAGPESQFAWLETFVGILLPGALAGGLLGWAELRRRDSRPMRALILAPLFFPLATLSLPGQLPTLLTTGLGSGALATPLIGIAGGYALAGNRHWARIVCGVLAVAIIPIGMAAIVILGFPVTPRGAWVGVLFISLLAVQAWACAIPLRPVPGPASPTTPVAPSTS